MSGGSLKDVKEMIGHADIAMTDRYSHISVQHLIKRQEQLAAHYTESLPVEKVWAGDKISIFAFKTKKQRIRITSNSL